MSQQLKEQENSLSSENGRKSGAITTTPSQPQDMSYGVRCWQPPYLQSPNHEHLSHIQGTQGDEVDCWPEVQIDSHAFAVGACGGVDRMLQKLPVSQDDGFLGHISQPYRQSSRSQEESPVAVPSFLKSQAYCGEHDFCWGQVPA